LAAGVAVNYGCSNGTCGACRGRLVSGEVRKVRPHDYVLTEAEKAAGEFLMCCNTVVADAVVEATVQGCAAIPRQHVPAKVRAVEPLGYHMAALHLTTPRSQRIRFLSGQSVTLTAPGGESADFSVASCPCEGRDITVHVRRNSGPFAAALDTLGRADTVLIDGPHGDLAFQEDRARPVVFIGLDEGFAPLKSLIQHAMSLEFAQPMHLVWAAGAVGHYRDNLCRSWADAFDSFTYTPVQAGEDVAARLPDVADVDVYAAGPPEFLDAVHAALTARGLPEDAWFVADGRK
jgi:CDP-4-dehydro-6-deoxyglucose reductase